VMYFGRVRYSQAIPVTIVADGCASIS